MWLRTPFLVGSILRIGLDRTPFQMVMKMADMNGGDAQTTYYSNWDSHSRKNWFMMGPYESKLLGVVPSTFTLV